MGFIMIRIDVPGMNDEQLNAKMSIDSTKPHEGVQSIVNFLDGTNGGTIAAQVNIAVRETTQAISADGDGDSGAYNLL